MADIPFNPSADQQPYPDFTASALSGAQAGQAMRGISALQGIDLNDPDSLNKGIGNLVRAGAADQASALVGLQVQRSALAGLPGLFAKLGALGDNSSPPGATPNPATPAAGTAAASSAPPAPAAPDPTAAAGLNAQMAADARTFSQTPPDQQPALAASLKQKYMNMGFPEASIDSALAHAATPGGADQLAAHYDAHSQLLTGGQPDQAALQAPGNTYSWAQKLLSDPGLQAAMQLYKKYGIDMTGMIGTAQSIEAPTIAKNAEIAAAPTLGTIAAQNIGKAEAAKTPYELTDVTLPDGSHAQVPKSLALVLGQGGALHGPSPEEQSRQTAAGAAAGTAPAHIVEVNMPDGSTQQGTFEPGPGGKYVFTPVQGAPSGVAGGEPIGRAPGIGAKTKMEGQAKALNDEATAAGQRLTAYPAAIARGQTLLGLANTVGTGAYTPALQKAAAALPIGHTAQQYAANAGLLSQDLAASFKDALQGLPVPRITSEAKSITGAIPSTASQQDQVKVYAAGILAANQYQQAHDQFIQQWAADQSKPPDLAQAQAAWQGSAGGKSLFTMPAWQGVTVGGKPAVDSYQYKGHTYIVPLPGLLGKNVSPIMVQ